MRRRRLLGDPGVKIARVIQRTRQLGGLFRSELWRGEGLIYEDKFKNGIVDAGANLLLDVMFHGVAATATWYLGIIDSSGYAALAAADTMASHGGWNEFATYTEAARVEWVEGAAAARAITNSSASVFSITGSGTLKGIFVTSVSTKSGNTGNLWSTALFSEAPVVANGDTLKIFYTVGA
jgi:hypothetical protein